MQIGLGVLLVAIIQAFMDFDWVRHEVFVGKDGQTKIVEKSPSSQTAVFLEAQNGNSAHNVTIPHVSECREKLKGGPRQWLEILGAAVRAQDTSAKVIDIRERYDRHRLVLPSVPSALFAQPPVASASGVHAVLLIESLIPSMWLSSAPCSTPTTQPAMASASNVPAVPSSGSAILQPSDDVVAASAADDVMDDVPDPWHPSQSPRLTAKAPLNRRVFL